MTKPSQYLQSCTRGVVVSSSVGHGSFVDIQIKMADGATTKLWIYLADWALMRDEKEVLSADMESDGFQANKSVINDLVGKSVEQVEFLPDREVHFAFSGGYRLELWPNVEAYGRDAILIRIYCQGTHVADF